MAIFPCFWLKWALIFC